MPLRYRATICKINHYFSHNCDNECEFCQKKPLPSPHNPDNPLTPRVPASPSPVLPRPCPRVLPRPSPVRVPPSPQGGRLFSIQRCHRCPPAVPQPLSRPCRYAAPAVPWAAALPPSPPPVQFPRVLPPSTPPCPQGGRLFSIQRCHRCPAFVPPPPLCRPRCPVGGGTAAVIPVRDPSAPRILRILRNIRSPARLHQPPQRPRV